MKFNIVSLAVSRGKRALRTSRSVGIALIVVACCSSALAGPLYELDTFGSGVGYPPGITLGFTFSVNSAITVTDLGIFDWSLDGLLEAHQVGLWNSGGSLLASVTVPSGTAAVLDGDFRYVAISSLSLTSGETYTLGAQYPTSNLEIVRGSATLFTPSVVNYLEDKQAGGAGFIQPTLSTGATNGFFGPNLLFVPEPSALILGLIALMGLSACTWRRRRRAA